MTGFTRSLLVALGAAVLATGSLQAQRHGPVDRHQVRRGERLERQGERMQRQAWRMDRQAERLDARGFAHRSHRLDRAADRRMAHGIARERHGKRLERRGWI